MTLDVANFYRQNRSELANEEDWNLSKPKMQQMQMENTRF